jgi:murein DD-endopeptidase MepM/ murein hydrolase activator NlpD
MEQNPVRFHKGRATPEGWARPKNDRFVSENAKSSKRALSFAVPGIPLTAVILLALGVYFGAYNEGLPGWLSREAVSAEKETSSQHSLALYAGIISGEKNSSSFADDGEENLSEDIPLDLTEVFTWKTYKVRKGDSVSKIAASFSVSMDAIIASNGISNARSLREGEVIRIPNMDGIPYTVKNGDSLSSISKTMGVPLEAILDANDIQSDVINAGQTLFIPGARMNREDLRMALGDLFIYPVKGARLSSPFGWRNDPFTGVRTHHAAVDLSAPQGTVVRAAMGGRVTALSYNNTYGNFIILSHPGDFQTMYAHLHSFSVKKGDAVVQGAQIGAVGNTGYSTGPHLHFAVFKNSRAVNPLDFLNAQR